jgi:predicted GNAT family N-acyltransferase
VPDPGEFLIQPLSATHDRQAFDCGVPSLTDYLRKTARQEMDRRSAAVYILVQADAPARIVGYYTLSNASVLLGDLPADVARRLPRYPNLPATLLGRLAVSLEFRGMRLGERLLVDALARSLDASARVGSIAVIVDAIDDSAAAFYEQYGFKGFPEMPRRLFMSMKNISASLRNR